MRSEVWIHSPLKKRVPKVKLVITDFSAMILPWSELGCCWLGKLTPLPPHRMNFAPGFVPSWPPHRWAQPHFVLPSRPLPGELETTRFYSHSGVSLSMTMINEIFGPSQRIWFSESKSLPSKRKDKTQAMTEVPGKKFNTMNELYHKFFFRWCKISKFI